MTFAVKPLLKTLFVSLAFALPVTTATSFYPTQVEAKAVRKSALPKPYVSRALKAVLMPVTKPVAKKFRLAKGAKGVMVVSVQPGGLAQQAGLKPGDVISTVLGHRVRQPLDVDTIIAYYLTNGVTDYALVGARKNGRTYRAVTPITWDYYYAPIDVYSVYEWTSFSYSSYSYAEYYSYYSETIVTSYEYSETVIEERITDTRFVSSMSETVTESASYDEEIVEGSYVSGGEGAVWASEVEEVTYDEADDPVEPAFAAEAEDTAFIDEAPAEGDIPDATEDADGYAVDEGTDAAAEEVADEATTDEGTADEGTADEGTADEPVADEGYTDEAATDESYTDEAVTDEGYTDEAATDESYTDEAASDESYTDEAASDEGYTDEAVTDEPVYEEEAAPECYGEVVDGSCVEAATEEPAYEEPAYEEPAYEEPAYEEPAYEEPAYEEPAYEEPAYEEPAYEEPAYDGGGEEYVE